MGKGNEEVVLILISIAIAMNIVKKFADVSGYIKYLDEGKVQDGFCDAATEGTAGWTGTESWDAAKRLLAYGDKEMEAKVNEAGVAKARAKISRVAKRKTFTTAIVGAVPHVPNYITGTPNAMITTKQVKTRKKVINLFYNAAFDSGVATDSIIKAAANVMAAVILIEAAGVKVNLYAGCISAKDNQLVSAIVKLKDSKQRLDVLKLCYPMVNPSWTRRHFIRFIDITPGVKSGFSWGHGSPLTTEKEKENVLKEAKITDCTILNYYDISKMSAAEEVVKYIETKTNK